jgi:Gram-negative bacterial TonB protein C-terminal
VRAVILALIATQAANGPMPPTACPETPVQLVQRFPKAPVACALCKPGYANGVRTGADVPSVGGVTGTPVFVMVTVNRDGSIASTAIVKSAGRDLDDRTIKFARLSTYKPATVNCKPVLGTYLFKTYYY